MRWSTSGRLTPAAATSMSTSPLPGAGTERRTGTSTSGPPGASGSIASMSRGKSRMAPPACVAMRSSADCYGAPASKSQEMQMDLDELLPRRKNDPLAELVKEDLTPLSRDELGERIRTMEGEITRPRAQLDAAGSVRSNADA